MASLSPYIRPPFINRKHYYYPSINSGSQRRRGRPRSRRQPPSTFSLSLLHRNLLLQIRGLDVQHVVAPDQDLAERPRELSLYELLRVLELQVHVSVGRRQLALVLLPPLEADAYVLPRQVGQEGLRVDDELGLSCARSVIIIRAARPQAVCEKCRRRSVGYCGQQGAL